MSAKGFHNFQLFCVKEIQSEGTACFFEINW